jgi:hypothetical protein
LTPVEGFASIFIAIDLKETYQPYTLSLAPVIVKAPPSFGKIDFPEDSKRSSICTGGLATFLHLMFQGEFYSWAADLSNAEIWNGCDPAKHVCDTVVWNFDGRDHRISGTIRVPIDIYFTDADANPPPGVKPTPHKGFLTIGFGGNGGAG